MSSKTLVLLTQAPGLCPTRCDRVLTIERERWDATHGRWIGELACSAGHRIVDARRLHEPRIHLWAAGGQPALF